MAGSSLFEAENLAFSYPGLDLLSDLSFEIKPGLTLLRGEVVWDGTRFIGTPGRGQFLPCGAPSLLPKRR